jgi:predicted DNA-binding transcriptional regulator AlpA
MSERLVTARELGERLGMSTAWVLDQWESGALPGFRLSSRAIRFRLSEVEQWLEARRRGPAIESASVRS